MINSMDTTAQEIAKVLDRVLKEYDIKDQRSFTKEEAKTYENALKNMSTERRKLYDV